MSWVKSIKDWARTLKQKIVMLWFASKHSQMPLFPKLIAVLAVAYAFSPIDLIPDFIPVLGFIDDALILPILIWLAVHFTPKQVMTEAQQQADDWIKQQQQKPKNYVVAALIVLIWLSLAVAGYFYFGGMV